MKRKNILLCWLSWSWKTTLAKHLNEKYGYNLLRTSDEIHFSLRKRFPLVFEKWKIEINSFSYDLTQFCTKIIQIIEIILKSKSKNWLVFDSCNLQKNIRDKILKILWNDSFIIQLECDKKDYLERFKKRSEENWTLNEKQFQTWLELHEKQKNKFQSPEKPDIIFNTSKNDFSWFDSSFKSKF